MNKPFSIHDWQAKQRLEEHHSGNKTDYNKVEKIMEKHFSAKKEMDEMSVTGTGASFQAGSGEGYMTPYAFKKKRKKD